MAYILGDTTLKNPASFERSEIEIAGVQTSITGRTTKDIRHRKEQFRIGLQNLTRTQVADIIAEYDKLTTVNFEVTETNLTIASTPVHIEISDRSFVGGGDYRENMVLTLTEVL